MMQVLTFHNFHRANVDVVLFLSDSIELQVMPTNRYQAGMVMQKLIATCPEGTNPLRGHNTDIIAFFFPQENKWQLTEPYQSAHPNSDGHTPLRFDSFTIKPHCEVTGDPVILTTATRFYTRD
jgi:hypothetical protein